MIVGQGLLGKIKFKDGTFPQYDRPYLVVYVDNSKIGLLNVSSVAGKEHKLAFRSNHLIQKYNPPFIKSSFVKLDSLVYMSHKESQDMYLLSNGQCLLYTELQKILSLITF